MRHKHKVLIVDDELELLLGLKRQLASQFDVTITISAREALETLESDGRFAVVISDMRMPQVNGIELLQQIKDRAPNITRIMLTGVADNQTAVEAVNEGGVFRFLQKPCAPAVLLDAIRQGVQEYLKKSAYLKATTQSEQTKQLTAGLFATMSHELRTPLNHIIGFAGMLEQVHPDDARYRDYAGHIQQSGTDLLNILTTLMDYSAAQCGRFELRLSRISAHDLAEDCARYMAELAPAKNLSFHVDIPSDMPDLFVDDDAIRQALFNLLSNAAKFSQPGGSVVLAAWVDDRNRVHMRVSDDGIGIAPQHLDRIVDPFNRVESALDGTYGGLGIGLPLTKILVELHGGDLEVESAEAVGTTVHIELPAGAMAETVRAVA